MYCSMQSKLKSLAQGINRKFMQFMYIYFINLFAFITNDVNKSIIKLEIEKNKIVVNCVTYNTSIFFENKFLLKNFV